MKRKAFLRLCERYRRQSKQFVYIDGSGFAPTINRIHDDAPQGTPVYGETGSGHKRLRTSTSLWEGTCNAQIFNDWLEKQCLHTLHENHVLIMDNADFHKFPQIKQNQRPDRKQRLQTSLSPSLLSRPQPHGKRLCQYQKITTIQL